jgi:alpha-L-fucosidase
MSMARPPHVAMLMALVLLSAPAVALAGEAASPADLKDDPLSSPRTQWFRDGKFGMFIHWGLYAVPAGVWKGKEIGGIGEWIMSNAHIPVAEYEPLAKEFNPVKFDAKAWVKVAKDAGMKYVVITSKHHDGFSMFRTKLTPYNIVDATPWKKDPMADLAAACKEAGLRFSFYHSIMDWHNPDQEKDFAKYSEYLHGQVKELLTQYGPLGILWFDGEWIGPWDAAKGRELYEFCRSIQPDLVVNNRVGKRGRTDGDYETPEQEIPAGAVKARLWETCMTLNDTWGYKTSDHNWKPAGDVVRKLVDIASKGGNFLLNVGPTAEGVIPPESVERLQEVGRWMKTNGDAIYGTTMSPWRRHAWDGRATTKGDVLYVHVYKWPEGSLKIAGLKGEVVGVKALDPAIALGKPEIAADGDATVITLPKPEKTDPADTVVAVRFKGKVEVAEASGAGKQAPDGTVTLGGADAVLHGSTIQYEADKDCVGFWTRADDGVSWDLAITRPGACGVEVTAACDKGSGGSEYVVACGDQQLKGTVGETGSWTQFETVKLGTLKIEKAGKSELSVKAASKPGLGVMNLRSIVLRPAP